MSRHSLQATVLAEICTLYALKRTVAGYLCG